MTKENTWLPLDQVAKQMGTTELNVLMHIKKNNLQAEEVDGKWFVLQASLNMFLSSPERSATVVTCKTHCCHSGCGSCS
ncbi:hypothetical protein SAMN05660420_02987 [Desulfuromusa kysingii]|uniref:DNA-binding protein n=1 Tax=Desulfuromusa kysingii TaxID=37625 RepID=A0A1H4DIU9_9BACT|nr:hypothetical protein [Desulfuromusa kysingii]SEA72701.1 hypothetical protein SAMN05660420_02987 [Desulfuromusa kysingii]